MEKLKLYGNKKREKGAITLFVLLACLFFVFILTGVYLSNLNRLQVQEQEVQQIHDNYAKDIDRAEEIYNDLVKTAVVTLRQEPSNGTWTKEVTLIGNAKLDEENTATIKYYTFNQESTENNPSEWDWKAVSENNVKELVNIEHEEKITQNDVYYYFWIKDSDGKIHRSNEVHIQNIDNNAPTAGTLIAKEQNEDETETVYDLEKSPWTDKDVKIEKVDGTDGEGETETVYTILKDGVEYDGSVTNPRTEPTTLTETGEYTVTVITTDEVGNTAEREYTIKIDKVVPILALKHNDANGVEYEQGTWTKDNLYGEISLDTSKTGKEVEKYQYSENGVIWKDISSEIIPISIDYTTTFPMSSDKPDWITGPINNGTYYFEVQADGTLKPTNGGNTGNTNSNTSSDSYFEIDLTNYPEASLDVILNTTISSENNYDFGYAELTESTEAIAFKNNNEYDIKVSGTTATNENTITITGGKKYYLHIGYYKDGSNSSNQDTFIINSISLKSEQLGKEMNFANYQKDGNKVTFTLNEDIEKEIYVRAVYTDSKTSKYGEKTSIKIDKKAPIIESAEGILHSREDAEIQVKVTEKGSGLKGYYISTDQTAPTENSSWTGQTLNEFTIENLSANTTYYLWVIDNVGNISERKDIVIGTANYIVDDKITTETLSEAITAASDGSIIKLLGDYTDTSTATFNKSVTFDVQSYTLTRQATITINSNKTVEITGTGKITSGTSSIHTITNSGTLTISNNITIENASSSYAPIYTNNSNSITNINDNVQIIGYYRGIYNYYGTLNVNGGKIEATNQSSSVYGIYNYSRSTVKTYINNGEIKGYNGIYNGSSSTLEMTGGKVVGTGAYGVAGYGTTNIYGGRIEGKTYGLYSTSTNKVTIGREEDELSTTNPAIYGASYGIYMNNETYSFNFYNGVIISNTKETSYRGKLNPRTGHMSYTYFDYDNEQKYCTILIPTVENITMEATPTEYTNGDVTVTITYPYVKGTRQYSEDGTTWKDTEEYIQEVIVTENKTIYARTTDESGIITDENQIEITNIDKEKPTVTITPNQTVYTVTETNGTVDLNITLTAQDTGVSGLDKMQYAWVKEGQEVKYTDFTNTVTISKTKLVIGQYNLYINVTDKAGNKADAVQMRYTVKYEEPVCQIGTTKYTTIQAAIEACSKTAGESKTSIEMLKSTDEEFSTYEGQNIILDLKGYTVGSSNIETPLCTNNGTLQLIDSSTEKTGKLESLNGTTILNNGTFTLGDNSTEIEYEVPTIYGYKIGIENNNIFNFYDGKIQGITPIKGNTTDTPKEYGPVSTGYENGITTIQLGIVTGYEARIEWVYYTTVQEAVNETRLYKEGHRDTVTIIKDIQLTNILEVNINKDIILDLSGYILTISSEQNTVIENYGNLEITDSSIEQIGEININSSKNGTSSNSKISTITISNNIGKLVISGGNINSTTTGTYNYSYGIYNNSNGSIEIKGGIVSSIGSRNYGIYNASTGTVKVIDGIVSSSNYGIYNSSSGNIEVAGGTISCNNNGSSSTYGIYNNERGNIKITRGTVSSNINADGFTFAASYGVYNNGNGNIEITGGILNCSGSYTMMNYGIYNNESGSIEITEGIVSCSGSYSTGIYNASTGIVKLIGGTLNCSGSRSYGIHNASTGIVKVINGTVNSSASISSSYGIYNKGIIVIGEKEDNVIQKEKPTIIGKFIGTSTSKSYGIYNNISGELEFYNGIIQGDIVLEGTVTQIREGYRIEENIIDGLNSIYLVERTYTDYIVQIENNMYYSLKEAIGSIGEDEKIIRVLRNFELDEITEFNKNIILDLNGFTITNNYYDISNIGNLTITDNTENKQGKLESIGTMIGITNKYDGNLKIEGGIVSSNSNSDSYGIYNASSGMVKVTEGTVSSSNTNRENDYSYGIYNEKDGIVEITGGTVSSGEYGIYNVSDGTVEITGGTVNSKGSKNDACGIKNLEKGTVIITKGIINCSSSNDRNAYGISNSGTGTITVTGGSINSSSTGNPYGISNSGTLKVTGGIITSNGSLEDSYAIYNNGSGIVEINAGILSSKGSRSCYGIYNVSTGTITIGIKGDGIVAQEDPLIQGMQTSTSTRYVGYGIYNIKGKLYFYDGKIEGTTKAVYEIITEKEENTEFNYNEDETILTLSTEQLPVAQIGDITYTDLQEAINSVTEENTIIKILRNVTYTIDNSAITIPNTKNIILDLNGYKITSAIVEKTIQNEGKLEITDTSENKTGIITTSEETTIYNATGAELIVSEGTIANRNSYAINNEGNLMIQGGTVSGIGYGIYNDGGGNIEVTGGTIGNNSNTAYGIYNKSDGSVEVIGGEVSGRECGIYNVNSGKVKILEGIINARKYGIYNNSTGSIEVTGGTISCSNTSNYDSYGIYNNSTGSIEVTGGTISNNNSSKYSYGIYNKSIGIVTIGVKGGTIISQEEPLIRSRKRSSATSSISYGIYNTNGKLYYYDGKIQGSDRAVYGNLNEIEDLTKIIISTETEESYTYQTVVLEQDSLSDAIMNEVEYDSISKAIKESRTNQNTIKLLKNTELRADIIIEKNQNIIIDLNGYTLSNYNEITNNGTLKIIDTSSEKTGKIVSSNENILSNTGTFELQAGTISDSAYGVRNTGTIIINGGNISNTTYGIYNEANGVVNVENGIISSNTYGIYNYASTSTANVNGGTITSNEYGIYNYNGNTNISSTGITSNTYGIYNAEGTTNIKEGAEVQSETGVYAAGGTVNIGEQGTMNPDTPIITGETYGLSVSATGTVYMYDGQVKGKTGATQGFITYTENGYAVANKIEGEYFVDYLALAGTIDAVAEVNGVKYSNLQSAINSIVGEEPQTIKLLNGIPSTMTYTIAEGQNIILDMNGKTISSDLNVTINNAGNLTIIDSSGSGVAKITSTIGTAIVNSGTLRLGQDDGTVSQDAITIEGETYGIETTGTLNFYDGTINGGSAVNGTVTNTPAGYSVKITTVNGKERYYLST